MSGTVKQCMLQDEVSLVAAFVRAVQDEVKY